MDRILNPGEDWMIVQIADDVDWIAQDSDDSFSGGFVIRVKQPDGSCRNPSRDELDKAIQWLNEQGSYSVTIFCRNDQCSAKGSWIRRSTDDVKKNVYTCEVCKHPMVR